MSELSSKQRILRVLNRQEPDRVPHFEWVVDKKVRAALLPGCTSNNDFAVRMGQDAVTSEPDFKNEQIAPGKWRTEWGYVVQHSDEDHGVESNPPIRTLEDLDRYVAPDPCATGRYASIEKTLAKYGEKKAVVVHLNDVFSIPRNLMGFENLLMAIAAEPELVRALVRLSVDINIAMAKEVASRGVKIVFTGDDYAGDSGPLMSPAHFQDLFADSLRQLVQGFKSLGLMVIKHTDGMLWPIIDPIVDSGIDCLDPIDPLAGMKLGEV
ncbi:MAG: uroporphyrinogen decarboxylase family protein, partial [Spirochaetia bacterium]